MKIKFEVEIDTCIDGDKDILEELIALINEMRDLIEEKAWPFLLNVV